MPNSWKYSSYISLTSPLLKNTDAYGLIGGFAFSAADIIPSNILSLSQGKTIKWAYFYPSNDGLQFMDKLIQSGKVILITKIQTSIVHMFVFFFIADTGHPTNLQI